MSTRNKGAYRTLGRGADRRVIRIHEQIIDKGEKASPEFDAMTLRARLGNLKTLLGNKVVDASDGTVKRLIEDTAVDMSAITAGNIMFNFGTRIGPDKVIYNGSELVIVGHRDISDKKGFTGTMVPAGSSAGKNFIQTSFSINIDKKNPSIITYRNAYKKVGA
jgi:hypothetical protein